MPTDVGNKVHMRKLTSPAQAQEQSQRPSTFLMKYYWLGLVGIAEERSYEDEKNDRNHARENQIQKDKDAFSSPEPETQFELDEDQSNQTSEGGIQPGFGC